MTTAAATTTKTPPTPATPEPKRARPTDLVTIYRKATKECLDVLGMVPDGVHRACIAAVVRECIATGRQELGFVAARDVIVGVLRDEISEVAK